MKLSLSPALALVTLLACGPCPCDHPQEKDAGSPTHAPALPPLEPDAVLLLLLFAPNI